MTPVRIVIMAKAPVAGFAKTRLIPALGARGAAGLAAALLRRTVQTALAAGVGPVELCATPGHQQADWHGTRLPAAAVWSDQGAGDLGQRMAQAAQRTLAGGEAVVLIGTDCPALSASDLQQAAAALQPGQFDAAMTPTFDGGYALLGLARFDARVFEGIAWSTSGVAATTLERAAQLGWRVMRFQTRHDIDEPADLQWLPSDAADELAAWRPAATDIGANPA